MIRWGGIGIAALQRKTRGWLSEVSEGITEEVGSGDGRGGLSREGPNGSPCSMRHNNRGQESPCSHCWLSPLQPHIHRPAHTVWPVKGCSALRRWECHQSLSRCRDQFSCWITGGFLFLALEHGVRLLTFDNGLTVWLFTCMYQSVGSVWWWIRAIEEYCEQERKRCPNVHLSGKRVEGSDVLYSWIRNYLLWLNRKLSFDGDGSVSWLETKQLNPRSWIFLSLLLARK